MQAFEVALPALKGKPPVPSLNLNVLDGLSEYIATAQFLHKLETAFVERPQAPAELHPHPHPLPARPLHSQGDEESTPLLHGEHEPCTATEPMETSSDEADASPSPLPPSASSDESYVMLNRQDAIEAMAYYIALHLSRVPEAQAMDPKQLQEALNGTFKAMRRSRFRQVWSWGTSLYRWSAVGYGAVQLVANPWLVRAVCTALWVSTQMAFGFIWM